MLRSFWSKSFASPLLEILSPLTYQVMLFSKTFAPDTSAWMFGMKSPSASGQPLNSPLEKLTFKLAGTSTLFSISVLQPPDSFTASSLIRWKIEVVPSFSKVKVSLKGSVAPPKFRTVFKTFGTVSPCGKSCHSRRVAFCSVPVIVGLNG